MKIIGRILVLAVPLLSGVLISTILLAQRREPDSQASIEVECLPMLKFGQYGALEGTYLQYSWSAEGPWFERRPTGQQAQSYWLRQVTADGFVVTKWKVE